MSIRVQMPAEPLKPGRSILGGGRRIYWASASTAILVWPRPSAVTLSGFAAQNSGSPTLAWWLVVTTMVIGAGGMLLNRQRENRP